MIPSRIVYITELKKGNSILYSYGGFRKLHFYALNVYLSLFNTANKKKDTLSA